MATTGFWPVKGQLKDVIDYAQNPDKTTDRRFLDDDLYQTLRYAENDSKTDRKMYVSAINCPKQRAYESMIATKRRFGKLGGNVAYHGYQSFAEDEVTPEEAHRIGMATAKQMWGEDYEVVVTTHLNTENIHNHFVVNSVSFRTGRKFENHISDHYRLREISDEICRNLGKSVLENATFYGGDKGAYWAKKSGKLTHREILKRDVEHCLSLSRSPVDLITRLKSMGYEIRNGYDGRNISVIAPGWQRAVRLSSIGYTKEVLNEWLAENRQDVYFYQWRNANPIRKTTPLLYLEIEFRKLDQYIEDYKLLCTEKIGTAEERSLFSEGLQQKITELEAQRNSVRNRIRRANPDDTSVLIEQAKEITKQIAPLRKRLKSAQRIAERIDPIRQLLDQERQMEQKERNRIRERSYER